jgi:ASC-1-like (ASCH) protein
MVEVMPKNHNWRIKRKYYDLINKGIKTLEVRVGYGDIKKVCKGDTITFSDYSNIKFEVIRITRYVDFPEMLDNGSVLCYHILCYYNV